MMAEAVQSPGLKRPAPLVVPASGSMDGSNSAGSRTRLELPAVLPPAAWQSSAAAGTGLVSHASGGHWQQLQPGVRGAVAVPTLTASGHAMAAEQAWALAALAKQSAALALRQHSASGQHLAKGPQPGGLFTAFGAAAYAAPAPSPAAVCGGVLPDATAQLCSSFLLSGTAQWARHAQGSSAASMRRNSPAGSEVQCGLEPAFSSSVAGLVLDGRPDATAAGGTASDAALGGWAPEVRISHTPCILFTLSSVYRSCLRGSCWWSKPSQSCPCAPQAAAHTMHGVCMGVPGSSLAGSHHDDHMTPAAAAVWACTCCCCGSLLHSAYCVRQTQHCPTTPQGFSAPMPASPGNCSFVQ